MATNLNKRLDFMDNCLTSGTYTAFSRGSQLGFYSGKGIRQIEKRNNMNAMINRDINFRRT